MKDIKEWLKEYCEDKWLIDYINYEFNYKFGEYFNYACVTDDGQVMLSTVEMFHSPDTNHWCFASSDVSCERVVSFTPDCCSLDYWNKEEKRYTFDWKTTKIKRNIS